jgi:predicted metal-dependent HD superfamily phosphohydrolase
MIDLSSLPWPDIVAVGIRTTADGPFAEDVFWQFMLDERCFEIPGQCIDGPAFDALCAHLPGADHEKIVRAMGSAEERIFRIWHREESRFCPGREDLAARFSALVGKLGGAPGDALGDALGDASEVASQVFDRVHAAWSAASRRYHSIEHLIDCLRELDAADARVPAVDLGLAELALWYHDVVYEPRASDCEERSAQQLLRDAVTLAIPDASARLAADLVRATAHTQICEASGSPTADLVVDIDLSILGRDFLRFMDYEYAVAEEYASVPAIAFRSGRRRVLAALLARAHIFRTEYFRDRYEQRARKQIEALLASPRYRRYGGSGPLHRALAWFSVVGSWLWGRAGACRRSLS